MEITATLGPVSLKKDVLMELSKKVSRFRINSAHIDIKDLRQTLRELPEDMSVVIDLQGAKVRIGEFVGSISLPEKVAIVNGSVSDDVGFIPLPDQQFFKSLRTGDRLYLNDAKVELEVTNTGRERIDAVVIKNGPLSSFKGINRKEHPAHFLKVSDADKKMIGASLKYQNIQYAVSFVLNGEEAKLYRPLVGHKRLIAKIERPEAMPHLVNIHRNFDELWFCRGDMGAQAGIANLQRVQDEFVANFAGFSKQKFIAGRLLWSMIEGRTPTDEELSNLYSAKKAGFDGMVLSDETAVGKNPLGVVDLVAGLS